MLFAWKLPQLFRNIGKGWRVNMTILNVEHYFQLKIFFVEKSNFAVTVSSEP